MFDAALMPSSLGHNVTCITLVAGKSKKNMEL